MKDYQNNEGALVSQKPRKLIGNGKQSRETIAKIHDLHKTFSLTRDVMPPAKSTAERDFSVSVLIKLEHLFLL